MDKKEKEDDKKVDVLSSSLSTTVKKNYAMEQSKIKLFWNKGITGEGIKVGIVDTGLQLDHPMYNGKILCGKNFSNDGNSEDNLSSFA